MELRGWRGERGTGVKQERRRRRKLEEVVSRAGASSLRVVRGGGIWWLQRVNVGIEVLIYTHSWDSARLVLTVDKVSGISRFGTRIRVRRVFSLYFLQKRELQVDLQGAESKEKRALR